MNITETIKWLAKERPENPRSFYTIKKREIVDIAAKSLWALQDIRRRVETQKGLLGDPAEKGNLYREGKAYAYEDVLKMIDETVERIGQ